MRRRLIPHSLQGRLILTYVLLMLLGLGGLIAWTGVRLRTAIIEQAEHDLELQALLMANALRDPLEAWREGERPKGRSLETLVHSYAESLNARVVIVAPSLQVIFSSDDTIPPHVERDHPEILAAQVGREQHDIRWDEWRNEERLFVAAPILKEEGELEGIVQLSIPMKPLYADIRHTWIRLLGAGGVILAVTVLVSILLARQVAGPIRNLTTVTEAVAAGNLDQQVKPAGPDELARLGNAFNRMAEQVREMLARQQAFVANAAHELRSPLTSIRLRIEMLQEHIEDKPQLARRYLRQLASEVEHLQRVVEHLLMLSRLDDARELPRAELDLAPLLYELADEMGPLAQAADLRLLVEVPPHLPPVAAHADAINMALRNLLDNAIKYTPAGGRIVLRATAEAGPENGTSAQEVIIQVSDTGPGIPPEHLSRIFDRFYRVNEARSRWQRGAGLGLSLVRSIVEAHGGRVEVKSQVGRGTTFTVHLPTINGHES